MSVTSVDGIEVRNGKGYMFSRRVNPYHQLGYVSQNDSDSAEFVLEQSMLNDWNVRLEPLIDFVGGDYSIAELGKSFVVRDNPAHRDDELEPKKNVLGIVSNNFHVLQNEQVLELGQEMTNYGARIETAGSLKNGATVFFALALESETIIDEGGVNEKIKSYLVLANGHDGFTSLHGAVTPIRPECTNTLNFGLKRASQSFKIRHSKNMSNRIQIAKATMDYTVKYLDTFAETMNDLHQTSITDKMFDEIIGNIYEKPDEDNKRGSTIWNTRRNDLWAIYESSTCENVRGTAYGALQAITELDQWGRRIRNDNLEAFYSAGAGFDNASNLERNRILNTLMETV